MTGLDGKLFEMSMKKTYFARKRYRLLLPFGYDGIQRVKWILWKDEGGKL